MEKSCKMCRHHHLASIEQFFFSPKNHVPSMIENFGNPTPRGLLPNPATWCIMLHIFVCASYTFLVPPHGPPKKKIKQLLKVLLIYNDLHRKYQNLLQLKVKISTICAFPSLWLIVGVFLGSLSVYMLLANTHLDSHALKGIFAFQMSHEKKKRPYFPLNPGCLIGILIMVY